MLQQIIDFILYVERITNRQLVCRLGELLERLNLSGTKFVSAHAFCATIFRLLTYFKIRQLA
ncbi:hypothetical protein BpHYR1_041005 [Brachionus plicatilis]|uniref:Uncharacterized protein n=1 Tax=Brachionus plicatilis TaxID=10195 RepID=A0A3M7QWP0_BRAPC|nr:hypothetical protein BpHYR1_041005 [Brachionus plicatilis]